MQTNSIVIHRSFISILILLFQQGFPIWCYFLTHDYLYWWLRLLRDKIMFPSKILYPGVPVILLNSKQYDVIMNNTTFIFHDSFLSSLICVFFFIYCFERGNSQFMIINDFKIQSSLLFTCSTCLFAATMYLILSGWDTYTTTFCLISFFTTREIVLFVCRSWGQDLYFVVYLPSKQTKIGRASCRERV